MKRKTSIRRQLSLIFGGVMVGLIVSVILVNTVFLPSFYMRERKAVIYRAYEQLLSTASSESYDTEELQRSLNEVARTYNLSIVIVDADSEVLYSSMNGDREVEDRLFAYVLNQLEEPEADNIIEQGNNYIIVQTQGGTGFNKKGTGFDAGSEGNAPGGVPGQDAPSPDGTEPGGANPGMPGGEDRFGNITNGIRHGMFGGDDYTFLEMYGRLDSGISFLMRTPVQSIQESAQFANRFFLTIGLIGTVLGVVIIYLVSRQITKPVLELSEISRRMVDLDFEAKYKGASRNEIGQLGENINRLSDSLEKSISGLKNANMQLRQDIEQKEKIDEMRQEFIGNVSHELKTPIALIQGYAEGLKEGINDDAESREFYCDVIMDEAAKMNGMVKSLLTLNQLEFGDADLNVQRFELTELIRNYLQSAQILAQQDEISVRFDCREPVYVWGDEYKAEEVLTNYFSNAVHYCKEVAGEKYVEVTLERRENAVRICVFNTGDQIPEESIGRLWDKFYKVDKARTRTYGGSGVGLSIVKAIQEALGYGYGVFNRENGVVFWYELEAK